MFFLLIILASVGTCGLTVQLYQARGRFQNAIALLERARETSDPWNKSSSYEEACCNYHVALEHALAAGLWCSGLVINGFLLGWVI
jgi:hypothetical protein